MRISKLSLICRFDKELTEIFKVKDITQSCSKNLMSGVGLSDPLPSVIELKPISLFLRVNNEGLCNGTKVRGMILLAISFFMFLEWRTNRHNIINFLNT